MNGKGGDQKIRLSGSPPKADQNISTVRCPVEISGLKINVSIRVHPVR